MMHLNIKMRKMKTIKLALSMAFVASAIFTDAVERPNLNVIPVNNERAIVAVSNENAAYMELSILASNGDVVYYRQTSDPVTSYQKLYDFKNLAHGKYVLNLKVNETNISNSFEVSPKGIKVGENKMTYDPWFAFNNNELKVSYLNFDQENLYLYLYNDNGLVYQKRLGRDFSITKGYDLSKLQNGVYKAVLSSGSHDYTFHLSK
jgi:hypothetical protein